MVNNGGDALEDIDDHNSKCISYLMGRAEYEDVKREYAKEKKASIAKKKPKQLNDTSGFTKVHKMINQKAVRSNMFSSSEKQMLFDLIPFCNLESNVITDEEGIPMSQKDIIELIGWSKAHVIEVMNGLLDKDVLSKVIRGKSVFYKVNKEWYGN
jgi:hypothetical protein